MSDVFYSDEIPYSSEGSNLKRVFNARKIKRENVFYAPSKYLLDPDGKPIEFEIRPVDSTEYKKIKEVNTAEIRDRARPNVRYEKRDGDGVIDDLAVASIVFPNLRDAALQDEYGASSAPDLLRKIIDNIGEYDDLINFIVTFNGIDIGLEEKAEQTKN